MGREEIIARIEAKVNSIELLADPIEYVKQMVKFLRTMHPSDAYNYTKDLTPSKNQRVMLCKKTDTKTYQELQDLAMECRKSYQHDNNLATNLDVDKAVSKAYGMTLRMIRANMDMEKERFNKIAEAINKIEEHLGLDVTNFNEGDENDTTNNEDAQGVKGSTDGTGEIGSAE